MFCDENFTRRKCYISVSCIYYLGIRFLKGDRLNFQWSYHLGSEQIDIFSYSLMQQSIDRHYIPILNVFLLYPIRVDHLYLRRARLISITPMRACLIITTPRRASIIPPRNSHNHYILRHARKV